jgi:hypothetical protein
VLDFGLGFVGELELGPLPRWFQGQFTLPVSVDAKSSPVATLVRLALGAPWRMDARAPLGAAGFMRRL